MATLAKYFNDGSSVDGKGYILKLKNIVELPNDKVRLLFTDSVNDPIKNIIVGKSDWEKKPAKIGQSVTILLTKLINLKNGKPAHYLREWNLPSADLEPKKMTKKIETTKNPHIISLANLSPYSNIWEIEVVLLKKDPIREWKKANSEGKVQNLLVSDDSGRIRITLWREDVDKFQFMEVGKMYKMSNMVIKPCDKQFNKTGMDYELHSKMGMEIIEVQGNSKSGIRYDFVKISEIENLEVEKTVDVTGILSTVEDLREVNLKTQDRIASVRNITLVDDSLSQIRATLWGKDAENFEGTVGCALEIKCASVNEFQGKTLAFRSDTIFQLKDELDENSQKQTQNLFNWWNNGGSESTFTPMTGGSNAGGNNQFSFFF